MRNRGIGRGRMFVGGLLLFAAVIAWATAMWMSPHGTRLANGPEHVRTTVVIFLRNSSIGTLVMCALAAWLLFPSRRPKKPARDWGLIAVIAVLVASSIYELIWLRTVVVS